jgi:hypothetical protein
MQWDPSTWDHDLFTAIQLYIALRKKYAALWRRGTYTRLYAQGKTYVFARQQAPHTVIVGVNAETRAVPLDLDVQGLLSNGTEVHDEWTGQPYTVTAGHIRGMTIPARQGGVWVA